MGDVLGPGQVIRSLAFSLRDGHKPMLEARVAGQSGVLMFDNGTPDALLLNRAAVSLPPGRWVASGAASSGQPVEVHAHAAPTVHLGGKAMVLPEVVRSGDFGFTVAALGPDFLGFLGTQAVQRDAFVLDYARRQWVVLRVDERGSLPVALSAADVLAQLRFLIGPGGLPTVTALLGGLPIRTDLDTGDGGTLYATTATLDQLRQKGQLAPEGALWQLRGLSMGDAVFGSTLVRWVEAGGPEDFRSAGKADQLRLGASFLAAHPCLWNFPAKTLTFLKPEAAFLRELPAAVAARP